MVPQIILMVQLLDMGLCVTLCLGLAVVLDVALHPGPAQRTESAASSHYAPLDVAFACICLKLCVYSGLVMSPL